MSDLNSLELRLRRVEDQLELLRLEGAYGGQPYSPRMVSTQAVSLPGSRVVTAQHANRTRHCRGAGSEIQSVTLGSAQFEHSFRILHKNSGLGRNLGT